MKTKFLDFKLSNKILDAIDALGYKRPSDVQEKVIPQILENRDIIVKSQTGSGKTAAFAIPLCDKIIWEESEPQVLVLTPTRELAVQVKEDINNIGRFKRIRSAAIFGKQKFSMQVRELNQKTHVIVGTPGRVLDHIEKWTLDTTNIKYLVIDEADEMLNMGFIDQVEAIIDKLPKDRLTLLFSATIPQRIEELCHEHMINPTKVEIEAQRLVTEKIDHFVYTVEEKDKLKNLNKILLTNVPETGVIFCRTKDNVDKVCDYLNDRKYSVNKIHGGMLQEERLDTMSRFKKGKFRLLVATDVAARGIDVEGITHVINFDLPMEKEAYVHRIGRTGRAGAKGKAITFVTKYEDRFLEGIEEYIGFKIEEHELLEDHVDKDGKARSILRTPPKAKQEKAKGINRGITKLYINAGRKKKIRAGDVVGAITKIKGITAEDIGIIDVQEAVTFVDILNDKANIVLKGLSKATIKGKKRKIEIAKK